MLPHISNSPAGMASASLGSPAVGPVAVSTADLSSVGVYDFECPENSSKWKGLLVTSLQKVQRQKHPSLSTTEGALEYVEELVLRLLAMLASQQPHTVIDVEERVRSTFLRPVNEWTIMEAQRILEKGGRKKVHFPVDKIHTLLQKEMLGYRIDLNVSLYLVAVLEYIAADILKLAGNYVMNIKHAEITFDDLKVAMNADKVLMDMFYPDDDSVSLSVDEEMLPGSRGSLTYEDLVKDMRHDEIQYIKDLNMIIKVFRAPFAARFPKSREVQVIFSDVLDIHESSVTFLGLLEDTMEMTEENQRPSVGKCFEEMVEDGEFLAYEKYTEDVLKPICTETLYALLKRSNVKQMLEKAGGNGFPDTVKFVLPKLLRVPIYHCLRYFETIRVLLKLKPDDEDKENLEQALGALRPLQVELERMAGNLPKTDLSVHFQGRANRKATSQKIKDVENSIDNWEGKELTQCCHEFITEGLLGKMGKKPTERYVFLFDLVIVLCKINNTRIRSSVTGLQQDYRLKEKFNLRKVDIIDRDDNGEVRHSFEIVPREGPHIILFAKCAEEKQNWMASLVMLQVANMLERMLDSIMSQEEKVLQLPTPQQYLFAQPDTDDNIVFEDNQLSIIGTPVIKGGTLVKLVERLTYHEYADPRYLRTFLVTFRSYCTPQELLDLLIQRFNIPEPNLDIPSEEELKRFRKEYSQPVQIRVLNACRQWVDHHFYDFEKDEKLKKKLEEFILSVKGKSMKKWTESIRKLMAKRSEAVGSDLNKDMFVERCKPPDIEWHLTSMVEDFNLMTLHPVEIARQLTLLEFELYKAVKPSELVGAVWIKEDEKSKSSPNLLRMIRQSTMTTLWFAKSIVEAENFEERMEIYKRICEILYVLNDLNNFNGVLEIIGALRSAAVDRLELTREVAKKYMPNKYLRVLQQAGKFSDDHYKTYQERLRSINPPCVPFFGMYLTQIVHIEDGNKDFLPNHPKQLINFSKRKKVAEIIAEIQQYQNLSYSLTVCQDIRSYLNKINPLSNFMSSVQHQEYMNGNMTQREFQKNFSDEFERYLFTKSHEIEPKACDKAPKFPRKSHYSLKSPGTKSMKTLPRQSNMTTASSTMNVDGSTPPTTPSTPLSPSFSSAVTVSSTCASSTAGGGGSDNLHSVFASINIGGAAAASVPQNTPPEIQTPPPLPPRRQKDVLLPPDDIPPPIPPRKRR